MRVNWDTLTAFFWPWDLQDESASHDDPATTDDKEVDEPLNTDLNDLVDVQNKVRPRDNLNERER